MAGDWLKFDKSTSDKAEVFAIAGELGIDPDAVVGKLMRVWSWFDTHTENGNARSVTSALLDRIAGVTGFMSAMQKSGWIDVHEGNVSLPNFDRHCGETAKKRAQNSKRVSDLRVRNATSVTSALQKHVPEKRREEKSKEQEQKIRSPSGSRLAQNWQLPDDWKTWAEQERPDLNVLDQAKRFADYWHGVAGAKGRKADWLATWRNWMRNAFVIGKPRSGPDYPPTQSKALQAIDKLQGTKNGMAQNGNQHRVIEADIARIGMGSGDGFDGRHGGGMDGSIDP